MSLERLGRNFCAVCIVIGVVALAGFSDRLSAAAIIFYILLIVLPAVYFVRSIIVNIRAEKRIKEREERLAELKEDSPDVAGKMILNHMENKDK